ncbi:hypothetical protein [Ralstonia solanacearum]|uniref:hypothetical protein n=1 Tax=Ralstonia solanacearum TaxID=305 RepID=UPI000AAEBF19|nr:hypothetical protein [Ralstonia solanacearum]
MPNNSAFTQTTFVLVGAVAPSPQSLLVSANIFRVVDSPKVFQVAGFPPARNPKK